MSMNSVVLDMHVDLIYERQHLEWFLLILTLNSTFLLVPTPFLTKTYEIIVIQGSGQQDVC